MRQLAFNIEAPFTDSLTEAEVMRFMSRCQTQTNGCITMPPNQRDGYAGFYVRGQKLPAHRVAYSCAKGIIPEGLEIDHLCGVRNCVNVDHLEAVTHQENILRSSKSKRSAKFVPKTHCKWATSERTRICTPLLVGKFSAARA